MARLSKGVFEPTYWQWKQAFPPQADLQAESSLIEESDIDIEGPNTLLLDGATFYNTIAEVKALPDGTFIELQCKPVKSTSTGYFIMAEDGTSDTLKVYYTNEVNITDRVNRTAGTMKTDASERVLCVDSGPGFNPAVDQTGSVMTAASGTIAWAKTFSDTTILPSPLSGKVVSQTFPELGYYYIQEPTREAGIRVNDEEAATILSPGDTVSICGDMTTVDGERAINHTSSDSGIPVDAPKPLGINNRGICGGNFNVYTPGATSAAGLNNVGLLTRTWGKITNVDFGGFYIDDGSGITDGGTATGIRVIGLDGYQPYTTSEGDYVAVTGISGLATYNSEYGLGRTIRVACSSDLTVVLYVGPPTEVEVQPTGTDAGGYGKLTIYWKAAPGATGYNIYRGTTSGGEDYQNPINGSIPWNTTTYTGSSKFAFTDTGLTFNQEYFYTVKAIRSTGESVASLEDSDIPDSYAIPWDSDNAYTITNAVATLYGYYADLICAVGPDDTVYSNWDGVLRPGGSVDLGTLEPGTNILHYSDGSTLTLPDDGGILLGDGGEESEMELLTSIPTTTLNASDGPYRRVRSVSTCTGSNGVFYPGWRNQISMSAQYPKDTYWTYLGSRTTVGSGKQKTVLEVDAGLQWSRVYYRYNPHLSLKYKRYDGVKARTLAPKNWPISFDTSYIGGIEMWYALQPSGKSSVPMILFYGADQNWEDKTVLLAAANPVKVTSGMMKRAHSIAQGKPNHYRITGSYVNNSSFAGGDLRNSSGQWVTWSSSLTSEQGAYPYPSSIVTWNPPTGTEYFAETGISINLR